MVFLPFPLPEFMQTNNKLVDIGNRLYIDTREKPLHGIVFDLPTFIATFWFCAKCWGHGNIVTVDLGCNRSFFQSPRSLWYHKKQQWHWRSRKGKKGRSILGKWPQSIKEWYVNCSCKNDEATLLSQWSRMGILFVPSSPAGAVGNIWWSNPPSPT